MTLETFTNWKACKVAEKLEAKQEEDKAKKKKLTKEERQMGVGMSGRDLFEFKPDVFANDASGDAGGEDDLDALIKQGLKVGAFEVDEPEPEAVDDESLFDEGSLFDEVDDGSLFDEPEMGDEGPKDPAEMAKEKIAVATQFEWDGDLVGAISMLQSALADFGGPGSRPKLEQRIKELEEQMAEEEEMDIDESLFDDLDDEDMAELDGAPQSRLDRTVAAFINVKIDESVFMDDASDEDGNLPGAKEDGEAAVDELLFEEGSDEESDEDLADFID